MTDRTRIFDGGEEKTERLAEAFNELIIEAHDNALAHGFWDGFYRTLTIINGTEDAEAAENCVTNQRLACLAKITSEIGEAVSAIQHGDNEEYLTELEDIVIRTLDLMGYENCDGGRRLTDKMAYNRTREYMHGKKC